MRHRGTGRLHHVSLVCAFTCTLASGFSAQADNLDQQRADYAAAIEAISLGDEEGYARLRGGLDDYPLAVYLDYYWLRRTVDDVSAEAARAFLDKSAETPLLNRFLSAYLREAGKSRRWQDFLTVKPDEPSSVYLKCYYFRAQLARGERALAWDGASRLWVHGESRPEECDPLFGAWLSAGQLNDDIVWTRLLNAFEARQPSLLNYVAKKSSPDLRPWADKLLAVYRDPATLRQQSLPSRHPRSRDIASYGLAYLARYSPPKALSYWTDLQQDMAFSSEQVRRVEHAIAQQLLFARTNRQEEWLQDVLARLEDDRLIGIRLRWALSEEDWTSVERYLPMFSENEQGKTAWRYWTAMVQEGRGDKEAARASLEKLAGERDYYGFLAADRLGLPYAFNDQQQDAQAVRLVDELPAVRRIEELIFHNDSVSAHAEWYRLLQSTDEIEELQNLMLLASGKGWHRMAIDAAARAEAWDALDHRFPAAHQSVFRQHAGIQSLPVTELMAIARRESAFDPRAESPVGARGLMQIMPATGKAVADSLKVPHSRAKLFEVEHNVKLGSAYYRQLLDRFDGNRVFALTAYNAGPHRVDRWRHESGEGLPVEFWIEAIPYRETRNYVQAVLAYNVVFQYLLGDTQQLLTPAERQAAY